MARVDVRNRNQKAFGTANQGPMDIDWASPKQAEAFYYGPAPLCISGGFGAAKTYALCLKALYLSDLYPRNRGLIARKIAKELERTTQATFFKICPPSAYDQKLGGRRADSENYLRFAHSGSEILWLHLDDPDIEGVIRGLEINWFFIDQAEELSEEMFDMLCSRLGRWDMAQVPPQMLLSAGGEENWPWKNPAGNPIVPTYAMIACNPDAETHWIYKRFHPDSQEWKERYAALNYKMISMRSDENKFLPQQNLEEMLRKDKSFVRRFVMAEWGIPEGQIHNIRPESLVAGNPAIAHYIQARSTLHLSLDHGDAAPTCCAEWAVDKDGNIFCLWEYYRANLLVSEHRKNITELCGADKIQFRLADPSMFYKTMQKYGGRWSFSDEYSDRSPQRGYDPETAINWYPADNDEMGTRNLINEYLRPQGNGEIHRGEEPTDDHGILVGPGQEHPRMHPITGEFGYWPRLYFLQKSADWPIGCDHIVRQTRSQRYERFGTENGRPIFTDERDHGIIDHGYDCLRYFISSRSGIPSAQARTYSENSFYGVRDKLIKFRRNGGWRRLAERASYAS